MPASSPALDKALTQALRELGEQLRDRRKCLKISAAATAEAANMSRITLHRIERGAASVAIGAYLGVAAALGLQLRLEDRSRARKKPSPPPPRIRIADYPTLKRLAWQLKGTQELEPKEALALYERNWKHVYPSKLDAHERELIEALLAAFGRERLFV